MHSVTGQSTLVCHLWNMKIEGTMIRFVVGGNDYPLTPTFRNRISGLLQPRSQTSVWIQQAWDDNRFYISQQRPNLLLLGEDLLILILLIYISLWLVLYLKSQLGESSGNGVWQGHQSAHLAASLQGTSIHARWWGNPWRIIPAFHVRWRLVIHYISTI